MDTTSKKIKKELSNPKKKISPFGVQRVCPGRSTNGQPLYEKRWKMKTGIQGDYVFGSQRVRPAKSNNDHLSYEKWWRNKFMRGHSSIFPMN